ncbi:MAG: alkyl sulfatase dimerization domain-containing protein [Desulfobacteraceae bacterium]|jgi:alkyl sulfatase BDS1-like metallo-beta-lactamase superfamily hydrolase|nr:alkyl sulfatase dimerization domain-containing protein [Desulfobacteraceae bacterium]
MQKLIFSALLLLMLTVVGLWFFASTAPKKATLPPVQQVEGSLADHSDLFKKSVQRIGTNVYAAIGYGLANSIMIVGQDGVIIVDTMTTNEEAACVLAEFRRITDKPVKAIIYTHNHADHVFGAEVFARGASPEVYAHTTTESLVMRIVTELRPIIGARSLRMFGSRLSEEQLVNAGIGPHLKLLPDSTLGFVPPTITFEEELNARVAGVTFSLIHAPGETDDQIYVWLPDERILICGDNFYWTFPNLYTIRGTPFRSLKQWRRSLIRARELNPEHLVPCHTRPLSGAAGIREILTHYADAIGYVHDQAIRGINMGLTPDELAETIHLPQHLAAAPYLHPFYGKVSWSVRAMFSGNLGWFDGDAANLQPLTRRERAAMIADLAGGVEKLLTRARQYAMEKNSQAALELTGHILRLDPQQQAARDLRVKLLTALAEREENPNARNYYLSEALEITRCESLKQGNVASAESLHRFPLEYFMESLCVNLDPIASAEVDQKVGLLFADAGRAFLIHVRFGVAEINERAPDTLRTEDVSILVEADSRVWREMLAGYGNPLKILAGYAYPKGNMVSFGRFMKLFQPGRMKLAYEPLSALKE